MSQFLIIFAIFVTASSQLTRCYTETNANSFTPAAGSFSYVYFKNAQPITATSPVISMSTFRLCFDQTTCVTSGQKPITLIKMIWSDGSSTDNTNLGYMDPNDSTCSQITISGQIKAIKAYQSAACYNYITRFDITTTTGIQSIGAASTASLTALDMTPIQGPISGFKVFGSHPQPIKSLGFLVDDCFCQQQAIATFPTVPTISMTLGTPKTQTLTKPSPMYPLEGVWTTTTQCTPVITGSESSFATVSGTTITVSTSLTNGAMIGTVTTKTLEAFFPKTPSNKLLIPLTYQTTALCSKNPITQNQAFASSTVNIKQGGVAQTITWPEASTFQGQYTNEWQESVSAPTCTISYRLTGQISDPAVTVTQATPNSNLKFTVTKTTATGTYTANLEAYYSACTGEAADPPNTKLSVPITINVLPCENNLVLSSQVQNVGYWKQGLTSTAQNIAIDVGGCQINYNFIVKVNGLSYNIINTPWLTIDSATYPTFIRIHDQTTTSTSNGQYDVTVQAVQSGVPTNLSNILTFKIYLDNNNCVNAVFSATNSLPMVGWDIGSSTTWTDMPFTRFKYSLNGIESTACGDITYSVTSQLSFFPISIVNSAGGSDPSQPKAISSTTSQLTLANLIAGQFQAKAYAKATTAVYHEVTAYLASYPQYNNQVYQQISIQTTIRFNCQSTELQCIQQNTIPIPVSGSATSFSFTEVYDSDGIANNGGVEANNNNFCGPRSYQISSTKIKKLDGTAAPTGLYNSVSLNVATKTFSVTPTSVSEYGKYRVQFDVWLTNYVSLQSQLTTTQPTTCEIDVEVVPNCNANVISVGTPAIVDMPTPVYGSATQQFGSFTDTIAGAYNNYCGVLTYTFATTIPTTNVNSITFTSSSNTLQSSFQDLNSYTNTITVGYPNYPAANKVVTFNAYGSVLCQYSKILSYTNLPQTQKIEATVGVVTTTPIAPMYHKYQSLWGTLDKCQICYSLIDVSGTANGLCIISGMAIVCQPVTSNVVGNTYQYWLVGSFCMPTQNGPIDNPALSTKNTVSFTVEIHGACTTITTFAPGNTIAADQRFVIGRDDTLSLPFTFAYFPTCKMKASYKVTVYKYGNQNPLAQNLILSDSQQNITQVISQNPGAGWTSLSKTWIWFDPSVPRIVIWSNKTEDAGIYPIEIQAIIGTVPPLNSFSNIKFNVTLSQHQCVLSTFMTTHKFQDMYFKIQDPTKLQDPTKTQLPYQQTAATLQTWNNQMSVGGNFYSIQMWPYYTDWITQDTRLNCGPRYYEFSGEIVEKGILTWGTKRSTFPTGENGLTQSNPAAIPGTVTADIYNLPPNQLNWDNWIKVETADPYYTDKWVVNFTVTLVNYQTLRETVYRTQMFTVWIDSECMTSKFIYSPFPDLIHKFSNGRPSVPFVQMTIKDIIDEYSLTVTAKDGLTFCKKRTYKLLSVSPASGTSLFTQPLIGELWTKAQGEANTQLFQVQATSESQYGDYTLTFNVGYTYYQYMQAQPYNIPENTVVTGTQLPFAKSLQKFGVLNPEYKLKTSSQHNIFQPNSQWAGPQPTVYTFTGRIVPDCQNTVWTPPVIQPMHTVVNAAVYQTIALFTHSEQNKFNNFCGQIVLSLTGSSYGLSIDSTGTYLTLAPTVLSTVGSMTAVLTATISNSLNIFPPTTSTSSFLITVTACTLTKYDAQYAVTIPYRYQIGRGQRVPFTFVKAPACDYLYDNPLQLASKNPSNHWFELYIDNVKSVETWNGEVKVIGNWVWLDFQQSWIEMYTTDRHLEGTHNIKVKNYNNRVIPNAQYDFVDVNFQLYALKSDCIWTKFISGSIPNYSFVITPTQGPMTEILPNFMDNVTQALQPLENCGPYKFVMTAITNANLHQFDSSTRSFTFFTNNPAHNGLTFQYSVYATLQNYPELTPFASWTTTFSVTVGADCTRTIFRTPTFPQYWVHVGRLQELQFPVIPDSVSIMNGDPSSFCGARTYQLSFGKFTQVTSVLTRNEFQDHSKFPQLAVVNGQTITSNPPNSEYVGFHQVFVTVGLVDYTLTNPKPVFEFQINVNYGCGDLSNATQFTIPTNMTTWVGQSRIKQYLYNVTTLSDQVYRIFNVSSTPNQYCGDNWSYDVTTTNGTFMPKLINYFTYNEQKQITVGSPQISEIGVYWLHYVYKHHVWSNLNGFNSFNVSVFNAHEIRANMPPMFANQNWYPAQLLQGEKLEFQVSFADPDQDKITATYKWEGPDLSQNFNNQSGLLVYTCPKYGVTHLVSTFVVSITDGLSAPITKKKQIWCNYPYEKTPVTVKPPLPKPKVYNKTEVVLKSISSDGLVTIEFSNRLNFGPKWQEFNKSGDFSQIMKVDYLPGYDRHNDPNGYYKNLQNFSWSFAQINATFMQIKLNLTHPNWVSQGDQPDQLVIKFLDPDAFRRDSSAIPQDTAIKWNIPPQIQSQQDLDYISSYFSGANIAFKAIAGINFIITVSMGHPTSVVLLAMRSAQIVAHLPMLRIKMPSNAVEGISQIQDTATYNMLNTSKLDFLMYHVENDQFIGRKLSEVTALSQPNYYLQRSNFKNCMFISNVGLPLYVFAIVFVFQLTLMQILRFFRKSKCVGVVYQWLDRQLNWSFFIVMLFETSLHSTIAAIINIKCYDQRNQNNMYFVSYTLSVAWLVTICTFIIFQSVMLIYTYRNKKQKDSWWVMRFGSLFRDIDVDNPWALLYPTWFLVSRILIAVILVLGEHMDSAYQFKMVEVILFITMGYNGWVQPIRMNPFVQKMTLINDFWTLVIVSYCGLFTDFENDPDVRYQQGYGFLGLLGLYFLTNALVVVWDTCFKVYTIVNRVAFKYTLKRHIESHPETFKKKVDCQSDQEIPIQQAVKDAAGYKDEPAGIEIEIEIPDTNQILPEIEKPYLQSIKKKSKLEIVQELERVDDKKVEQHSRVQLNTSIVDIMTLDDPVSEDEQSEIIDIAKLQRQRIQLIMHKHDDPSLFSASKHGRIKTKGWIQPELDLSGDFEHQ